MAGSQYTYQVAVDTSTLQAAASEIKNTLGTAAADFMSVGGDPLAGLKRSTQDMLGQMQGMKQAYSDMLAAPTANAVQHLQQLKADLNEIRAKPLDLITTEDLAQARQLQQQINSLQSDFAAAGQNVVGGGGMFGGLTAALGPLKGVLGTLGLAVGVKEIGQFIFASGNLGEAVDQTRRRFETFAGGPQQATEALAAMRKAMDGGIDSMTAMDTASRLMSMGLAKTGDEAANITRIAAMLGSATRTVEDKVSDFTMLLANQSIRRLDQFGISVDQVRARIDEMKAADASLGDQQAFVNAVLEIGGARVKDLEANGVKAARSIDEMTSAWADFRAAFGKKLENPVSGVESWTAAMLRDLTTMLQGPSESTKRFAEYQKAIAATADAADWLNFAQQHLSDHEVEMAQRAYDVARADEAVARTMYEVAAATQDANLNGEQISVWADAGAGALFRLRAAADAAANMPTFMSAEETGALRWMGLGNQYAANQQATRDNAAGRNADALRWAGLGQSYTDANEAIKRANADAAKDYQTQMGKAIDNIAGEYKSALVGAQNDSIGLLDLRPGGAGGQNAPGAGGFAENIYRLQAFIQDGSWSETAQQFGLDKAGATDVVRKFQSGMWDSSVMQVLDVKALKQQIKDQQVAKTMMDAVADDLAAETNSDPKIVRAMLNWNTGGGDGATAGGASVVADFTTGLTTALDTQFASADFKGKMGGYGSLMIREIFTVWQKDAGSQPWALALMAQIQANLIAVFEAQKGGAK